MPPSSMGTAKPKRFAPECRRRLIEQVGIKLNHVLTARTLGLVASPNEGAMQHELLQKTRAGVAPYERLDYMPARRSGDFPNGPLPIPIFQIGVLRLFVIGFVGFAPLFCPAFADSSEKRALRFECFRSHEPCFIKNGNLETFVIRSATRPTGSTPAESKPTRRKRSPFLSQRYK